MIMEDNKNQKKVTNKKLALMAIPIAAVLAIASVGVATNLFGFNKTTDASRDASCLPSTIENAAITAFPVKEPSSLPQGYALRAVEADGGGKAGVVLYYSDKSLCPFEGGLTDQVQNGTLVITAIAAPDIKDSADFQQREVKYYAGEPDTIADVKAIDVGGHKGIGWEPFTGKDIIRKEGKVVQDDPMPMPGMVRFFDDNDKTIYSVTAMRPLGELVEVAASIK